MQAQAKKGEFFISLKNDACGSMTANCFHDHGSAFFLLDLGPCVLEGHCAVEDRLLFGVARVGAEIDQPLELHPIPRCETGQARLDEAGQNRQRVRVYRIQKSLARLDVFGIVLQEQGIVKTNLRFQGMRRRDPMQSPFDLAIVGRATAPALRIIGADETRHITFCVFAHVLAGDVIGAAKTHFPTRGQPEEFFTCILATSILPSPGIA